VSALARAIFGLREAKERIFLKFRNLRRLMVPREEEREFALPREYGSAPEPRPLKIGLNAFSGSGACRGHFEIFLKLQEQ
jgi:hypothetical protein